MLYRWTQRRIQGADLTRDGLGSDRRLDGPTVLMPEYQNGRGAKNSGPILKACHNFGRADVTGDPRDKDMADGLVEYQFHRHTRIRAGQHRRKWLLLGNGALPKNIHVFSK